MRKLTHIEAVNRLEQVHQNRITAIGEYPGRHGHWHVRCQHGHEWRADSGQLFQGSSCRICNHRKASDALFKSHEEVVANIEKVHRNKIIVLGQCQGIRNPVLVESLQCGHQWFSKPATLLYTATRNSDVCPDCSPYRLFSQEKALARLSEIHQDKIIAVDQYRGSDKLWTVKCRQCSYEWSSKAANLFGRSRGKGNGCPKCAQRGFNIGKPGILYYVRVSNPFGEPLYKIGITNRSVKQRLHRDIRKITIIETWHFENGAEAFEMEQDILNDYDTDRWTGPNVLTDGNDELFNIDVLGLDTGRTGQLELVA
jgi:hypothetical protein